MTNEQTPPNEQDGMDGKSPSTAGLERTIAAEVMRFVRGAQGMTHDERSWFVERIEPIIRTAIVGEREAIINAIPGGDIVDPQWVCDMIRERSNK